MQRSHLFQKGGYYHVYNRGVDKRDIFLDTQDYRRFVACLHALNSKRCFGSTKLYLNDPPLIDPQDRLVAIIAYCLMPNHYHLELEQICENGISKFLQRLDNSYTKYFNNRYDRAGCLLEGAYKVVQVDSDEYLIHLSRYVHLNPLDLIRPGWKETGIADWGSVKKFVETYPWSSYTAFLGSAPGVACPKIIFERGFRDSSDYRQYVSEWAIKDLEKIQGLLIE